MLKSYVLGSQTLDHVRSSFLKTPICRWNRKGPDSVGLGWHPGSTSLGNAVAGDFLVVIFWLFLENCALDLSLKFKGRPAMCPTVDMFCLTSIMLTLMADSLLIFKIQIPSTAWQIGEYSNTEPKVPHGNHQLELNNFTPCKGAWALNFAMVYTLPQSLLFLFMLSTWCL